MEEILGRFSSGQLIGLVAVILGPMIAIVAVVASQWRRVRIAEVEGALKQQMLDKGMSAAEIEQVMRASNQPVSSSKHSSTGNESLDKAALAQRMVDEGYEGADIERVLRAYQPPARPTDDKAFVNRE